MASHEVWNSSVSIWEIALKPTQGKLVEAELVVATLPEPLAGQGFRELVADHRHGLRAGRLPLNHKDPFDRLLIAQATAGNPMLVSNDRRFDRYGVERLWR